MVLFRSSNSYFFGVDRIIKLITSNKKENIININLTLIVHFAQTWNKMRFFLLPITIFFVEFCCCGLMFTWHSFTIYHKHEYFRMSNMAFSMTLYVNLHFSLNNIKYNPNLSFKKEREKKSNWIEEIFEIVICMSMIWINDEL